MIISYDGTDFNGWQIQPDAPSVCLVLQDSFFGVFKIKIKILGASRTDSGVHALGQVATFKTDLQIEPEKLKDAWNNSLPNSIMIRSLEKVSQDFYPLIGVKQKTYYYNLFLKRPLPFVARYGFYYEFINFVDLQKFEQALNLYVGKHDFASFCKIDKGDERNTVKTIDSISIHKKEEELRITIKGKAFLRFQIRRMVGYALDVARRPDLSVNYIHELLDNPDSKQKLLKAEACGLCLGRVVYEQDRTFK